MIKLFRKIRQNLLSEGKTGKYFKYAIGEIVLVVIGILIALQINNWNQDLHEQKIVTTYLKGIYEDLSTQALSLEETIPLNENVIFTINAIIDDYQRHDGFKANDSLLSQINQVLNTPGPIEIKTSFTELLNSGDLGLMNNNELRKNIVLFYQDLEDRFQRSKINIINIYQAHLLPDLAARTIIRSPGQYAHIKGSLNEYFKKREYSERLKNIAFRRIEKRRYRARFIELLEFKASYRIT
ncbi:DUF6090 family protein [uncultured Psychroserpens sp.]|uniref:DUF6090 family protein n=1 Tax=uncultured Psychroserpens sp. TaxID=255436 RepID=UPI002611C412|nr:DUF6090 family protein [uncultured Psychroserpens sp.]